MPSDWERVAADPALLAALRRRYAGSGDPLDRLWWREHPGEPTPEGTPDPADAIEASRRALFRPGAATASAEDVERAAAAAAADREAALVALGEADREVRRDPEAPRAGAFRSSGRAVLAGAVVAALLVGAGVGFALGRFAGGPEPAALAVFARAQRADDRPPSVADLPSTVIPASTRFLGASGTTGTSVYAARATDGRVCLIAVVLADQGITSCASDAAFADSGLSLAFSASVDPTDDSGTVALQELRPTWTPEGRLTF